MKHVVVVVTATALGVLAADSAVAETWQGYAYTTGAWENERLTAMAETIGEITNGELQINYTRGGGLPINGNDIQQAIAEDILQFGIAGGGAVSFIPIYGISRLPGIYMNGEDFSTAAEVLTPYLEAAFAEKGVTLLCSHLYPEQSIFATVPVESLDDLAGLRVRVSSPEQGAIVEAVGAIPVTLVASDVPPALQQGAVDAVLTAAAGGGRLWADLLSYNYRMPVNWAQGMMIVNTARLEALSPEVQGQLRELANTECQTITEGSLGSEAEWVQTLSDGGMTMVEPTEEDLARLQELSAPIWESTVAPLGEAGAEAFAAVQDALSR
mgnify:CR=1 FL=1